MFKLFQTKFTFNFNGEVYILNQNPDTDVSIEDPKKIEGKKGSDGTPVFYGTGQGDPITITASGIGIGVNLLLFIAGQGGVFDQNLDGLGLFTLSLTGKDHTGKSFETTYSDCSFAERPRQTAIGQSVPEISMVVLAFDENMRAI